MPPRTNRRRGGGNVSGNGTNRSNTTNPDPAGTQSTPGPRHPRPPRHRVPAPPRPADSVDAEEAHAQTCSICAERAQDWAVGNCPHVVCGDCSHRMRVLYDRKACVMCNVELRQVVVVPLRHYRLDMDFERAVALPGAFQDKQVEMWFVDRMRSQQLRNVRGWKCSHKQCNGKSAQTSVFANAAQLRTHVRTEHHAVYCEICFSGKKSFVSEMEQYTMDADRNYSSRLRGHLRKKHPQCRFCRHYFLDDEKLYAHLQEKHETCFICERNGRLHEYYLNYEQLENHYRKEHYVCRDEACRGVVFATQIELQTHEHTRHNDTSRNSRARALRVNLQQLHGERDPRRRRGDSARDVRIEQERQAARRQAFLSSAVVFSGARNFEDAPIPSPSDALQSSAQPYSASEARASSTGAAAAPASRNTPAEARRPDDGHFYPLALPRDGEELASRNTILVRTMRSLLDPAAYEQFRMSSGHFHSGKISADDYYAAVTDAFGVRASVRDILPELVALLPTPLLREPLLETCLRRTDTKGSSVGYLGPSGTGAGTSDASSARTTQVEQFPSLSGAPAPARATAQPMRRFGTPGPEDFPRLGRVNKPQGNRASMPSAALHPSSSASASSSRPNPPVREGNSLAQKTAASVLRQAPPSHKRVSALQGSASVGRGAGGGGAQLSSNAFPALRSVMPATESRVTANRREPGWMDSSNDASDAPNPDVAMRAGAVWGGVAAGAYNRPGKKRGPGRGQGRRPASPPKLLVLGTSEFPNIRAASQSQNDSLSNCQGSDPKEGKSTVIDVMEIAKARRTAKNNLPRVGGSGYGFAWDRKKVQQKKKQIRSSVGYPNGNSSTAGVGSSFQASSSASTMANSFGNSGATEPSSESEVTNLSERITDVSFGDAMGSSEEVHSAPEPESEEFDRFAFLNQQPPDDDAAAAFLGRPK